MKHPQVTDEMLERAKAKIEEAQKAAIERHSRGAFATFKEIDEQIDKQSMQLWRAARYLHSTETISKEKRAVVMENIAYQLAQIGQLAEFALASMETWDE